METCQKVPARQTGARGKTEGPTDGVGTTAKKRFTTSLATLDAGTHGDLEKGGGGKEKKAQPSTGLLKRLKKYNNNNNETVFVGITCELSVDVSHACSGILCIIDSPRRNQSLLDSQVCSQFCSSPDESRVE